MSSSADAQPQSAVLEVASLIFVGFNSRVAALDRTSGQVVWKWKSPKGSGLAALLLDGDRLIVSVQGYTYCLDPLSGDVIWTNPLKGMGLGTTCLASARGNTTPQLYAVLDEFERQQQHARAADG
jgi:outer membrane protein assembly factor BamB